MEKAYKIGEMRFCLDEYRESKFNNSVDCTFALYGSDFDEIMSIELYHAFCCQFAAALGFSEDTINTWFGGE